MRTKLVVLVIAIFILLPIVIFLAVRGTELFNDEENRKLQFILPSCIKLAGEEYEIGILNIPDDAKVEWDLGDGNFTSGKCARIRYTLSGIYNVSATAKWNRGKGEGSIQLYIHNKDVELTSSGSSLGNINPRATESGAVEGFLRPGIISPQVRITISLKEGTGSFQVYTRFHYTEFNEGETFLNHRFSPAFYIS